MSSRVNLRTGLVASVATLYGLTGVIADLTGHDGLFHMMAAPVSVVAVMLTIAAIACCIVYAAQKNSEPLIGILESAAAAAPATLATPWVVSPAYGLSLAGPSSFVSTLESALSPLVVFGVVCFGVCAFGPLIALALRGALRVLFVVTPLTICGLVMLVQMDLRAFVIGLYFARQTELANVMYAPIGGPLLRALALVAAIVFAAQSYKTTKSSGST